MRRLVTVLLLFIFGVTLSTAQQPADPLHQLSNSFESLVARISPAVVEIFVSGYGAAESDEDNPSAPISRQSSLGSGVIVDPDGYIVTNYHVIRGAQRVNVLVTPPARESQVSAALRPEPRSLPARIVGFSKSADLAVLKIDAKGLPTVQFAKYIQLRQGQLVLAFGSPEGLQNSVSMGLVSSVLRQVDPRSSMVFIQTDAAINPGNSGGALVDVDGNLVGINSSIFTQSGGNEGLGFAIPSGIVRFVYQQIREHGRVRRGDIGADVQTLTPALTSALDISTQSGVIVSDVFPGSPAADAGLKTYDLIQTINGVPVVNVSSFVMNMYLLKIGDRARVGILRSGKELTLDIPVVELRQGVESIADLVDPEKDMIPELGIFGVDFTPEAAGLMMPTRTPSGVIVAGTTADHRAEEIGLQLGDVIHSVNATSIANLTAFRTALGGLKPHEPAALQVERGGRVMFLTFEIE
jgi:serine protease Do